VRAEQDEQPGQHSCRQFRILPVHGFSRSSEMSV
jgi:hypothetical protein